MEDRNKSVVTSELDFKQIAIKIKHQTAAHINSPIKICKSDLNGNPVLFV